MNFKNLVGKTIAILAIVSLLSIAGCSNTNQAANNTTPKQKTTQTSQSLSNSSNNNTPSNNVVLNPNTLSKEEVASRLQKIDSEIAQQEQQNNTDSHNTAPKTSTSSDDSSSYTEKETSISTSTEKFIITVQGKRYHKPNCPTIKHLLLERKLKIWDIHHVAFAIHKN